MIVTLTANPSMDRTVELNHEIKRGINQGVDVGLGELGDAAENGLLSHGCTFR